jgi:intracellular septation protein A
MDVLASILGGLAGLVSLVCFVMVLIQMFQRGYTGMGVACIVLLFCCGIGGLVTFVFGWIKAREWNMVQLMTIWSVAVGIGIVAGAINPAPYMAWRETIVINK